MLNDRMHMFRIIQDKPTYLDCQLSLLQEGNGHRRLKQSQTMLLIVACEGHADDPTFIQLLRYDIALMCS